MTPNTIIGVVGFLILAVIIGDIVTHPTAVTALGNTFNQALKTARR